jgi:Protein of unknown function (DUF2958)
MKLLTKALQAKIPKLYETERVPLPEKVAHAKFFHPISNWEWYVLEYDGQAICFGLVVGHETEFGYFSLKELSSLSLPVERDLYFQPMQIQDLAVYGIERVAA